MGCVASFFIKNKLSNPDKKKDILLDKQISHIAIIMDGNRRWAKLHNLPTEIGYKKGLEAAKTAMNFCLKNKIKYLSLFALSAENLQKRNPDEIEIISNLLKDFSLLDKTNSKEPRVKIKFVGDKNIIQSNLMPIIENIENKSDKSPSLEINILFGYGGQQEIVAATKDFCKLVLQKKITIDEISPELFAKYTWTSNFPPPDFVIRTGFRKRVSNFLLWQLAYAEIIFLDIFWPDITEDILLDCCGLFLESDQSFGR